MAPHFHGLRTSRQNTEWGPWELWMDYRLVHKGTNYQIDFATVNSSADMLNWVMHMSTKCHKTYGEDFLYHLSTAFADILKYCGVNITENVEFNGETLCKKYLKVVKPYRYISVRKRHTVLERDKFRCQDCGASPATGAVLEIDHTIPVSKGGSNELHNLRTLCSDCNRGKSDRLVNYTEFTDA